MRTAWPTSHGKALKCNRLRALTRTLAAPLSRPNSSTELAEARSRPERRDPS